MSDLLIIPDMEVIRGDNGSFALEIYGEDETTLVDITGWTFWFTVRKSPALSSINSDDDSLISCKVTNFPTFGTVEFDISESDTNIDGGDYVADIQIKKLDRTINQVNPLYIQLSTI